MRGIKKISQKEFNITIRDWVRVFEIQGIDTLKYRIKDSDYQSERYYRLDKSYQCTGNSRWDDYSEQAFGIQFVYDKFCDDVIEKKKQLYYGKYIGFKSKEECQKYCDWLNRRKDI